MYNSYDLVEFRLEYKDVRISMESMSISMKKLCVVAVFILISFALKAEETEHPEGWGRSKKRL